MERARERESAQEHDAPRQFVDKHDADRDTEDGEEPIEGVGDDRGARGEPGVGEQLRAVVHDRVDTGELLRDPEADADDDQPQHPLRGEVGESAGLRLLLLFGEELDFLHLRLGARGRPDLFEHLECLVVPVLGDQPAGALREEEHADEQGDRREHGDGEHVAPHSGVLTPDVEDDRIDDESGELTDDDHHLIACDERPTSFERGEFGR